VKHRRMHSPYNYDLIVYYLGVFMSLTNFASMAIAESNVDTLLEILQKLSKEEIQDLASRFKVHSATINMFGSWVESCLVNIVDIHQNIIQKDIPREQSLCGDIQQLYSAESLHFASLVVLQDNTDYDEDYFEPRTMLFDGDFGYPADSSSYDFDCRHQELILPRSLTEDEDFDLDNYEIDDYDSLITIDTASISVISIELIFENGTNLDLPLNRSNAKLDWFVFSLLFMSSKKSLQDFNRLDYIISEFMKEHFDIDV